MQKWIFIKDSMIEFGDWPLLLPLPEAGLLNLGVAGETAEGLLRRLRSMLDRLPEPNLILIMTGTNNVGLEEYRFMPAYEEIIELLRDTFPQAEIIVNCLFPIRLPWLPDEIVPRVNQTLKSMALQKGVLFLDIYDRFITVQGHADEECFQADGVHLSQHGYRVWADSLALFIRGWR